MITKNDVLKSLVLFLLNDVDVDTEETSLELYARWRKSNRIAVLDPINAAWVLDYLEEQKNFSRDDIREAARLDGFLIGGKK